jgi:hypothetical protein
MENQPPPTPNQQPRPQKVDKEVKLKELELWGQALELVKPIISYYENKLAKHDSPIAKSTIWGFITIICVVLIGSTVLLALDKIDKANFTFIVGSILGYLFSMSKMFFTVKDKNE